MKYLRVHYPGEDKQATCPYLIELKYRGESYTVCSHRGILKWKCLGDPCDIRKMEVDIKKCVRCGEPGTMFIENHWLCNRHYEQEWD